MVNLGFSIFPEKHEITVMKSYIDLLSKHHVTRIFISLLQIPSDDYVTFDKYKQIIAYANALGLKVIADISPAFIEQAKWSGQLIEKAQEFGLNGFRLDEALPLDEIVQLTHNKFGIKIELNMSTDNHLLTKLLAANANKQNIIACHNFYPHEFTGLSVEHFNKMSKYYFENGIETAAFVNAQTSTEGPWELSEGLCTVEEHRHLPIQIQGALLKATGYIDNILIANQFIGEQELIELVEVMQAQVLTIPIRPLVNLTKVERDILNYEHIYRGDISSYVIRSTMSRVHFVHSDISPRQQNNAVKRGTIIIDNDLYARYKGELQIALQTFEVSDKANIVAEIDEQSLSLLDYLSPWQKFRFKIIEK